MVISISLNNFFLQKRKLSKGEKYANKEETLVSGTSDIRRIQITAVSVIRIGLAKIYI